MDFIPAPKLPFEAHALEPHISRETIHYHHGKHHMAYFNKTREFQQGKDPKTLEEIVKTSEGAVYNNAAQLYNHAFYWKCMAGNPNAEPRNPKGPIADLINASFGTFDKFQEKFDAIAKAAFGSGWVWAVLRDGAVQLMEGHDGDCPLKGERGQPLLCLDVWEHAYYIDYRNVRPDYITAWWNLINWDFVNDQLTHDTAYTYQKHN